MSGLDAVGAETLLSPEEIEARLAAQRLELAHSVDELATRVDPRTQVREAGAELSGQVSSAAASLREKGSELRERVQDPSTYADLRERALSLREQAQETITRAQEGDSRSLKVVAAVTGGAVAGAFLLGSLISRSSRR